MSQHLVLMGATASGKSDIAIELALHHNPHSEIISLDSMQIYKGMEIGTGVVPINERKGIVHHQIGFVEPTHEHSVKQFQSEVYDIISTYPQQHFVLAGGTGMYTHAIVDHFQFAPTDAESRAGIIEKYELDENNPDPEKVADAYEILSELDPVAADKIDPMNVRRIVRALEAIEISGIKFSETGEGVQTFAQPYLDVEMVGLRYSRDVLRERIAARVQSMVDAGWVEEVQALLPRWDELTAPARNAIGYAPIAQWIRDGGDQHYFDQLKEHIVNKTAQFSRRQRKWFERDPRITWVDCDDLSQNDIIDKVATIVSW